MIAYALLTAGLYVVLLYPFQGLTFFGGYADFGRVGVGIPIAFSFLFGPAAAWGTAIGNVIRDILESHLDPSSFFGFIGNFLLGYVPYKLWRAISAEEPDLRSIKKFTLFAGIAVLACILCGIVIGWGLYWLGYTPFMPTVLIIAVTNALWAVIVGSIVLALSYGFVSKRKILYPDIIQLEEKKLSWNKTKSLAILALIVSVVLCIATAIFFSVSPFLLLPFVALSLVATGIACK